MAEHGTCPVCTSIYRLNHGLLVGHSFRGSLANGECRGSGKLPTKTATFERCSECGRGDWKLHQFDGEATP